MPGGCSVCHLNERFSRPSKLAHGYRGDLIKVIGNNSLTPTPNPNPDNDCDAVQLQGNMRAVTCVRQEPHLRFGKKFPYFTLAGLEGEAAQFDPLWRRVTNRVSAK